MRRNRRRYGGYLVHAGVAVLMLGIAASSAFNTQRDVRLGPGETTRVAGYDVRYVRPTADFSNEKLSFGAVLDVRKDGKRVTLLRPSRNYYPAQDLSMGTLGRFFRGESTSEVGLRSGFSRDLWTAMQPDLRVLNAPIREANRRFADASPRVQGILIAALAQRYLNKQPPATFRLIVNPMVTWIWVGGLIVLSGALMALWPSARRRGSAAAAWLAASTRRRLRLGCASPHRRRSRAVLTVARRIPRRSAARAAELPAGPGSDRDRRRGGGAGRRAAGARGRQ